MGKGGDTAGKGLASVCSLLMDVFSRAKISWYCSAGGCDDETFSADSRAFHVLDVDIQSARRPGHICEKRRGL